MELEKVLEGLNKTLKHNWFERTLTAHGTLYTKQLKGYGFTLKYILEPLGGHLTPLEETKKECLWALLVAHVMQNLSKYGVDFALTFSDSIKQHFMSMLKVTENQNLNISINNCRFSLDHSYKFVIKRFKRKGKTYGSISVSSILRYKDLSDEICELPPNDVSKTYEFFFEVPKLTKSYHTLPWTYVQGR